jgi:hypothetical protein
VCERRRQVVADDTSNVILSEDVGGYIHKDLGETADASRRSAWKLSAKRCA